MNRMLSPDAVSKRTRKIAIAIGVFALGVAGVHCGPGYTVTNDAARDHNPADTGSTDGSSDNDVVAPGDASDVTSLPDVPDPPDASITPAYLPRDRTFDQQRDYIAWQGPVAYETITHRDGTSLPPSEGGASCGGGCTEQVTRINPGGCVYGNFIDLCGFRVQLAAEPGAGTGVVTACGQTVGSFNMAASGTPGFVNLPTAGSWAPPIHDACEWRICATGSFVHFRAVTPTYCAAIALPTVDLRVNGLTGRIILSDPASYTLTWTSTNAVSCMATLDWTGGVLSSGGRAFHSMPARAEDYVYHLSCENSMGFAEAEVSVSVQRPPG